MQHFQSIKPAALLSVLALAALPAATASSQEAGWYIGANGGLGKAHIDEKEIRDDLLDAGLDVTEFREDDDHFGFKVFMGYQFNRVLSLEAGYFDLGKFSFTADTLPAGSLEEEITVQGVNLDLLLTLPLSEVFSAFVRAGANYAEAEVTFAGSGAVAVLEKTRSERNTNYKYGLGLEYLLTDSLGLRAEAERYRIDDAVGNTGDVDLYSAGLVYRFGRQPPVAAPVAAPLPRAEPAPAPASPLPPTPPRDSDNDGVTDDLDKCPGTPAGVAVDRNGCPLRGSITLEGVTFEYDSAMLTAESRKLLDVIANDLVKYGRLRVEMQGHTDSVGSDQYNRALSQRRAEAVRTYLIDHGVSADRLTARGYGEAQPIDDNGTDAGRSRNRRVVMQVLENPGDVKIEGEGTIER